MWNISCTRVQSEFSSSAVARGVDVQDDALAVELLARIDRIAAARRDDDVHGRHREVAVVTGDGIRGELNPVHHVGGLLGEVRIQRHGDAASAGDEALIVGGSALA